MQLTSLHEGYWRLEEQADLSGRHIKYHKLIHMEIPVEALQPQYFFARLEVFHYELLHLFTSTIPPLIHMVSLTLLFPMLCFLSAFSSQALYI